MSIQIFLVDDHQIVRDGLTLLLEREPDFVVIGSEPDGKAFLEVADKHCPDVVFMDIDMPGVDGITATRLLGKVCATAKVIILSMHESREYIFRALNAGAKGYLLKDSTGREAVAAVRAILAGNVYLSSRITTKVVDGMLVQENQATDADRLQTLTTREMEVFELLASGCTRAEIAEKLALAVGTVSSYHSRILKKLNIKDTKELMRFALTRGIVSSDN